VVTPRKSGGGEHTPLRRLPSAERPARLVLTAALWVPCDFAPSPGSLVALSTGISLPAAAKTIDRHRLGRRIVALPVAADKLAPMRSAAKKPHPEAHDPTFYPVEEKVGEDSLQRLILELLRPLVERYYQRAGKPTFVGADQFIYYKRFHPGKVVAPDVYVLPGVPPGRRVKSWKTWLTGIVPSLAIEVLTSDDAEKDYREAPERYAELGVDELIAYDDAFTRSDDRVRWRRYRKLSKRGFVRVESTNADRIRSRTLGCFLRVVGEGDAARLRLATGPTGEVLFPTEAEAERAAKEEALREVAELRARLAELGDTPKPPTKRGRGRARA
jgi:Putative restriction endonuclease